MRYETTEGCICGSFDKLEDLEYEVVRQRGSHVRLSYRGKHFITVPVHKM
ncbi:MULTISPECIES: type II toxin-antitoxin system HicA family toxin [Thermotoga]|nr:type II toxin-antitoxin system HicA family toxin [Thermotoga petrophila]